MNTPNTPSQSSFQIPMHRSVGGSWPGLVLAFSLAVAMVAGLTATPAMAQESSETAPESDAGSLTWSVRPTPTDAEPDRPNFGYDVAPGDVVEDSIRVRNFGDQPLALDIYASDAITTSSGALDLLPAGEEPTDVGAWIVLATDRIEIPVGEAVDVPFTLTVPDGVEPGDHVGGIVTSHTAASEDDGGEAVVLDRRLGSRVQVRVDGDLVPSLAINDLTVVHDGTLNPIGSGTATVTYTITNIGNVRMAANQRVVIPGRFGLPGPEVTPDPMPELLPDNSLPFEVVVDDVWPTFATTATVELVAVPTREGDVFDGETFTSSATTSSIPWGQLAVVAALVILVLWIVWSRRRRTRREAAIREQARAEARAERAATTPIKPM